MYLVRHSHHSLVDSVLCGRMNGVALTAAGVIESDRVAVELERRGVERIECSPRLRAQQTAAAVAKRIKLPIETVMAVDELDLGEWTGQVFDALAADPRWHEWNSRRGTARPPGGESMRELQSRVVAHLEALRTGAAGSTVIVSHAEPIRAAILHYKGMDLDAYSEIAIDPSSISIVRFDVATVDTSDVNRRALT